MKSRNNALDSPEPSPFKIRPRWKRFSRNHQHDVPEDDLDLMVRFSERLCRVMKRIGLADRGRTILRCSTASVEERRRAAAAGVRAVTTNECRDMLCPTCAGLVRGRRKRAATKQLDRGVPEEARLVHVVLTLQHTAADNPIKLGRAMRKAFAAVVDSRRPLLKQHLLGAYYVEHLSWRDGPRHLRVRERPDLTGWHPHLHVFVVVEEASADRAFRLMRRVWKRSVQKTCGKTARMSIIKGDDDRERRCGYFHRSQAKYLATLSFADLKTAVRYLVGSKGSRGRRLSGSVGCLRRGR